MKKNPIFKIAKIVTLIFFISSCKDSSNEISPISSNNKSKNARSANYCASCLKYEYNFSSQKLFSSIYLKKFNVKVYSEFGAPDVYLEINNGGSINGKLSGQYPLDQYFTLLGTVSSSTLVRLKFNYFGNVEYTPWKQF